MTWVSENIAQVLEDVDLSDVRGTKKRRKGGVINRRVIGELFLEESVGNISRHR